MKPNESSYYLALYDIMGIQNFIFSTNKLQENVGSSSIVENLLKKKDFEDKILKNVFSNFLPLDYRNTSDFDISEKKYDGILIYAAGGNALLLSKEKEKIIETTQELSKRVLSETGNLLSVAMATIPTDFTNFIKDYNKIELAIKNNKREKIKTMPLLGIAITKEEFSTGLPAQYCIRYENDLEYVSYPTILKRKVGQTDCYKKKYLDALGEIASNYEFPKEIDNLGQIRGQNYIAVIHIDGNDMGMRCKKLLQDISDYSNALILMNELSNKITDLFTTTTRETIRDLIVNLNNFNDRKIIDWDGTNLPIRPLILNGDDITFITHGKLGIGFAEAFFHNLKRLQKDKKEYFQIKGNPLNISASGGVLIINSKFPFFRAYEICKKLCRSAKTWGKAFEIEGNKNDMKLDEFKPTEKSWIDFHICHSTININLKEIRRHLYNIIGMDTPDPFNVYLNEKSYVIPQYNLLWRPWCINVSKESPEIVKKHDWSSLINLIDNLKNHEWSKNKLMKFKKSLLTSQENLEQFLLELPKNNLEIPEIFESNQMWRDFKTPYFDALDLLDYYYPIIE